MTVYPQEYTLHCVKTGHYKYDLMIEIGTNSIASYIECQTDLLCANSVVLHRNNNTVEHTFDISWNGQTITGVSSFSQSNVGDQTFQCIVKVTSQPIRRRNLTIKGNYITECVNLILNSVPGSAPSSLTVVNKTATTITVNWTALNSSDADGYVVNVTSDTDTVQTVQVEGSSNNTITLNGLRVETTYNITVRAYQQLLGPASSTISVQTLPGIATAPVNVLVTLLMYF